MLGEVIRRSTKTVSDLNSDQAHADDMTKLGTFSSLLLDCSRSRRPTPANTIHQSSHPTLLTSHIRVANRKAMKISTKLRASIDVASTPPDLSALPIGGGVVGFSISVKQTQRCKVVDSETYWSVDLRNANLNARQRRQLLFSLPLSGRWKKGRRDWATMTFCTALPELTLPRALICCVIELCSRATVVHELCRLANYISLCPPKLHRGKGS